MEVKPGYKQTEAGVIPENWDVESFNQTLKRQNAKAFQIQTSAYLPNGLLPVVDQSQNAIAGYTDETDRRFKCSEEGVIVFGDHTCVVKFVDFDFVVGADGTQLLTAKHENSTRFHAYALEHNGVLSTGYNRHFKFLKERLFVRPPLPEQRVIATSLSDVDGLLGGLDQLIAKKRDLKQAAMQELLSGNTRLPGFIDEWEVRRLGDLVQIEKGQLVTRSTLLPGEIPVIAGGKKPAYHHAVANRSGRTITISASGANAGYVALYNDPIFASDCSTISESDRYCLDFVYYQLLRAQPEIYKLQTGGAQPHIHAKDLNPMTFSFPDLTEQAAIAGVLIDLDAEVAGLEARREKTQALKQGMMQELLTGRIRLLQPEALHA
jgi:hypothetical protein